LIANNVWSGIDIAVGVKFLNELKKNFNIEDFVDDELSLIISKSHLLLKKKNKENLYCLNFITLNSNSTIKNLLIIF
jgi:hypothetical protein